MFTKDAKNKTLRDLIDKANEYSVRDELPPGDINYIDLSSFQAKVKALYGDVELIQSINIYNSLIHLYRALDSSAAFLVVTDLKFEIKSNYSSTSDGKALPLFKQLSLDSSNKLNGLSWDDQNILRWSQFNEFFLANVKECKISKSKLFDLKAHFNTSIDIRTRDTKFAISTPKNANNYIIILFNYQARTVATPTLQLYKQMTIYFDAAKEDEPIISSHEWGAEAPLANTTSYEAIIEMNGESPIVTFAGSLTAAASYPITDSRTEETTFFSSFKDYYSDLKARPSIIKNLRTSGDVFNGVDPTSYIKEWRVVISGSRKIGKYYYTSPTLPQLESPYRDVVSYPNPGNLEPDPNEVEPDKYILNFDVESYQSLNGAIFYGKLIQNESDKSLRLSGATYNANVRAKNLIIWNRLRKMFILSVIDGPYKGLAYLTVENGVVQLRDGDGNSTYPLPFQVVLKTTDIISYNGFQTIYFATNEVGRNQLIGLLIFIKSTPSQLACIVSLREVLIPGDSQQLVVVENLLVNHYVFKGWEGVIRTLSYHNSTPLTTPYLFGPIDNYNQNNNPQRFVGKSEDNDLLFDDAITQITSTSNSLLIVGRIDQYDMAILPSKYWSIYSNTNNPLFTYEKVISKNDTISVNLNATIQFQVIDKISSVDGSVKEQASITWSQSYLTPNTKSKIVIANARMNGALFPIFIKDYTIDENQSILNLDLILANFDKGVTINPPIDLLNGNGEVICSLNESLNPLSAKLFKLKIYYNN